MSKWIRNLSTHLENSPVVIVHGNVRDRYIDEHGRIYENLTPLLCELAQHLPIDFAELVLYDAVSGQRRLPLNGNVAASTNTFEPDNSELADTRPNKQAAGKHAEPFQVIAEWLGMLNRADANRFIVVQYLDKLVAYKNTYLEEERKTLLWLEKVIENISAGHRLVMVALQDPMIPTELYTHAPKTAVFSIPRPDKADRTAYLEHRLGKDSMDPEVMDSMADLTDGMYLLQLDALVTGVRRSAEPLTKRQVAPFVNKYRIGEQEDHWGNLGIEKLDSAYKFFVEEQRVKGQDEAIRRVIDTLCLARAGLSGMASGTTAKPKGVLFFAGPTGVGKTLVAKKLALFLFGTEEAFLRFDMSEFKEEHSVSKLIGSPPGYVGFEQGGGLTNGVRDKPFSVVLFDEIEKAHPKIMDIYLQLLDDGRLTDSRGQTVFFSETFIIFTSNIGTRSADSSGREVDEFNAMERLLRMEEEKPGERKERIRNHFVEAVQHFFNWEISRPELLNRIGNRIVPFNHIDSSDVQLAIIASHLRRIEEEIREKHRKVGHKVHFDDSVAKRLVDRYGDHIRRFGGRGITNAVEDEILMPLARPLLRAEHDGAKGIVFRCGFVSGSDQLNVTSG
jgi:hypothetical protein